MFGEYKKKYKEKLLESEKEFKFKNSHSEILNLAKIWLNGKTNEEQVILLDYLISVLLEDICTSGIIHPLISAPTTPFPPPFPDIYVDENGKMNSIESKEKIEVDLAETMIYVCPWNNSRIPSNLFNLVQNPFIYQKNNHSSYFYTDINLCYVHNGNHSISIGRYLKKGKIISNIYRTELLYPYVKTDGLFWYNTMPKNEVMKVEDFRLASVYSLAKIRYNLRK